MPDVFNDRLPDLPWLDPRLRRLPGIQPLDPRDWLLIDEAYPLQMAERDRLIARHAAEVHVLDPEALPAAQELLALVLEDLGGRTDFGVDAAAVRRPDGVEVPIDRTAPLLTLGRLVQEDFCLLQRRGDEHVMTGAILCFPASWTLAEKFLRPLTGIHRPVHDYDATLAARVQRLFDAIRPEQPLWRANVMGYADPALHHPRREAAPRPRPDGIPPFVRAERQCLRRLPQTRAVVFSIHTFVVLRERLDPRQAAALAEMGL